MGRPTTLERGEHWEQGNRIRMAFDYADKGISYAEWGRKLGKSAGGVGKLINGRIAGSTETLRAIAILTNVNFEWLVTGRGDMVYRFGGGMLNAEGLTEEQRKTVEAVIASYKAQK